MKRRMKPNPDPREKGYHSREHDEDPTCHKTHEGDTPCEPVESDAPSAPCITTGAPPSMDEGDVAAGLCAAASDMPCREGRP
jgi:hypothetical protein